MFITLTPSGFEVLHKHTFTMQNPLYWWSRGEFLTCGHCSPLSREGNRHPLETPSDYYACGE